MPHLRGLRAACLHMRAPLSRRRRTRACGRSTAGAVLRRGSGGSRGRGAPTTKRQAPIGAQRRGLFACGHDDRGTCGAGGGGVSRSGDGGDRGVHRQSSQLAFRRTSSVSDFKHSAFKGALISEFFSGAL